MLDKETEIISHPSFGQVSFSRINGGNGEFYGSELSANHYIQMTVENSEIERSLSKDWYFTKGIPLIKIRMTAIQFSELITSLNTGGGTPCTIEMIDGKRTEAYTKAETRKGFVHRKFEDRMKEFGDTIRERQQQAKELVKKKTLSKQDIHDLTHHLEWLTGEVEMNIPFFAKCFQENMDEVVLEAKTEIESAIQHKINVLGLNALHEQNQLLENNQK